MFTFLNCYHPMNKIIYWIYMGMCYIVVMLEERNWFIASLHSFHVVYIVLKFYICCKMHLKPTSQLQQFSKNRKFHENFIIVVSCQCRFELSTVVLIFLMLTSLKGCWSVWRFFYIDRIFPICLIQSRYRIYKIKKSTNFLFWRRVIPLL